MTTQILSNQNELPAVAAQAALPDSPQRWLVVVLLHFGMVACFVQRGTLAAAAPFMINELGLSTSAMGVLLSAFFWSYAFMQSPAGWAVDRFGVRRVYALGFAVWSLAAAASGLARGVVALVLLRACLGVGQAVIFPAHARAIANLFAPRERGTAISFANAGNRLGQAFINGVGPWLIAAVGWQLFFFTTGLLPLVWLLPWLLFMRRWESAHTSASDASGGAQPHPMSWRESFALLKQRSLLGICLGYGCYNYCWIVMLTWLPGYLKLERGFNARELAVFSSVPYVIGFFVALAAGVMSDWFVRRGVAELRVRKAFMLSGMAVACLIIPAGIVADKLTAVGLLAAALCGLSASGVNSWLVTQAVCDKQIVGTATGLQNFFGNLSGIVAPALTGLIAQTTGSFALALGLTGALLMAGIVFYWLMVAEKVTTASTPFGGD